MYDSGMALTFMTSKLRHSFQPIKRTSVGSLIKPEQYGTRSQSKIQTTKMKKKLF